MTDATPRRVFLQVGFGLGQAFLQAWHDWRLDPKRAVRLDFIAITPSPPDAGTLRLAHRGTALQALAGELAAIWPPLTRNLHRLGFDGAQVHLLLGVGQPLDLLPELQARVDDFLIDEVVLSTDPQRALLRLCKGLARLAAPMARMRAASSLQALRPALASAGFEREPVMGEANEIRAVFNPRFVPRRRSRLLPQDGERHALIVGAGLAGCATACALAEQGWRSTLIDRTGAPAMEASGNPAGLFHGIVNPQDGAHARFNRAAALLAQRTVQEAIHSGVARGSAQGLLRLDTRGLGVHAMRAELAALQLPPDYVQALDAAQASTRCSLALRHPAWFYPGGGWVEPAALARWFLQQAGRAAEFRGDRQVQSLRAAGGRWQLLDADGGLIAEAGAVVLANAADALRLMNASHWPVEAVRGQISLVRHLSTDQGMHLPKLPLAGAGYLLPDIEGLAVFGASSQPGDVDTRVREADHTFNLKRLAQLSPASLPAQGLESAPLQGRVGWRCVAADRLPLVGAAPDEAAFGQAQIERLVAVPRLPGLHVFSALGSRGICWAAMGAQVLAARISGAPVPLETSLVDALDPARFALRAAHRARPRG
jgi:tRNA 5-methylaminomethyl-2-thiouridine biosynthesis bifunctional protein